MSDIYRETQKKLPLIIGNKYRIATVSGEIIEGVYVGHNAINEAWTRSGAGYNVYIDDHPGRMDYDKIIWTPNIYDFTEDDRELFCPQQHEATKQFSVTKLTINKDERGRSVKWTQNGQTFKGRLNDDGTAEGPTIVDERPIVLSDNPDLDAVLNTVIEAHRQAADDYVAGKMNALSFLVGKSLKIVRAKPEEIKARLEKLLADQQKRPT